MTEGTHIDVVHVEGGAPPLLPETAEWAVLCNALYLGSTPGWLVGLLHVDGTLPTVHYQ